MVELLYNPVLVNNIYIKKQNSKKNSNLQLHQFITANYNMTFYLNTFLAPMKYALYDTAKWKSNVLRCCSLSLMV